MQPDSPEAGSLRAILGAKLGDIDRIVPIESGTTGNSYRIYAVTGRYVAKVFHADSDALLGPRAQYDLLTRLAPIGLAPQAAACDESKRVLVTEYIEGAAAVSAAEVRRQVAIQKIAVLLGRLHRSGVDAPLYQPVIYAERYLERLGGVTRLSPKDRARSAELSDLAAGLQFEGACLCHNDLLAENILLGQTPILIDFDYAALAPPVLDLASVSVMNEFAPAEETQLLNAYGADTASKSWMAEFAKVKRLVRLLGHFWSMASSDAGAAIVSKYRMDDV